MSMSFFTAKRITIIVIILVLVAAGLIIWQVFFASSGQSKIAQELSKLPPSFATGYQAVQSGDAANCSNVTDPKVRSLCVTVIAIKQHNAQICTAAASIPGTPVFENYGTTTNAIPVSAENFCYVTYRSQTGDTSACNNITIPALAQNCLSSHPGSIDPSLVATSTQLAVCQKLAGSPMQSICVAQLAQIKRAPTICLTLASSTSSTSSTASTSYLVSLPDRCLVQYFQFTHDTTACSLLSTSAKKVFTCQ